MYVYFPKQNVLAVGDVVSNQGWPVVDWATGGWIGGIVGGLQRLQTLANAERASCPARGPVLGLAELKAQAEMYTTIYDRLTTMLNKGRGPDRGRCGEADQGIRCADGQSRRVRAARIREPVGILIAGCVDDETHDSTLVVVGSLAALLAWRRVRRLADARVHRASSRGAVRGVRAPTRRSSSRRSSSTASRVTTIAPRRRASASRASPRRASASTPTCSRRPCASCAAA